MCYFESSLETYVLPSKKGDVNPVIADEEFMDASVRRVSGEDGSKVSPVLNLGLSDVLIDQTPRRH